MNEKSSINEPFATQLKFDTIVKNFETILELI